MNAIAAILPVIRVKRPKFINTISSEILADFEDSDEIRYEVAHKQCDST